MAMEPRLQRLVAEFLGTFLLVLAIVCNVPSTEGDWAAGSPVWGPTAVGMTLMVLVYCLADISGANFNPAVSLSLGLSKELPWEDVGAYCVVQLVAGILGALVAGMLFLKDLEVHPSVGSGAWPQACLAELLFACLLCFVVLRAGAAKRDRGAQFYGFAIGLVIVAAQGATKLSGGCLNPAANLGFTIAHGGLIHGSWGPAYVLCDLLGAALAAALHGALRSQPEPALAEFLGTFFLVLAAGVNVMLGAPAWSVAAALAALVFVLGDVSAHLNPAVSVAQAAAGNISWPRAGEFIGAQLAGGLLGALSYSFIAGSFPLQYGPGFTTQHAMFAELLFTCLLCTVVLTMQGPEFLGLAVGLCVMAGSAVGPISGGILNPAVAFGAAITSGSTGFWRFLPWCVAEVLGGGLAAAIFSLTHSDLYDARAKALP